jgi:NAD(P)-dependent dehydrogenase (short-subunit alcohol dehydrogenase family)
VVSHTGVDRRGGPGRDRVAGLPGGGRRLPGTARGIGEGAHAASGSLRDRHAIEQAHDRGDVAGGVADAGHGQRWLAAARPAGDHGAAPDGGGQPRRPQLGRGGDAAATSGPYTATKAALQSVAVTLAREEAVNGVRVNVLAPSLIRSPMAEEVLRRKGVSDPEAHYRALPWGRPLDADEVAAARLAVALDPPWRYVSGRVIPLTGPDG